MEHEDHGGKQDQLEEHSLPGTNQGGKGPGACEKNDQEDKPGGRRAQHQEQLEEHSLPGTNQAGKEPGACEKNDQENKPGGRGARDQEQLEGAQPSPAPGR